MHRLALKLQNDEVQLMWGYVCFPGDTLQLLGRKKAVPLNTSESSLNFISDHRFWKNPQSDC